MKNLTVISREPAAWLAFVAVVVKLVSAFVIEVTPDQQSLINAVAAAVAGVVVAIMVHDGIAAAVYGFIQAALALAVGFGLQWSADQQAVVLSFVSIVLALFIRTQVVAKTRPVIPGRLVGGVWVTSYDEPRTGGETPDFVGEHSNPKIIGTDRS